MEWERDLRKSPVVTPEAHRWFSESDEDAVDLAPCQPIGCDNGIHLPGCQFEEVNEND